VERRRRVERLVALHVAAWGWALRAPALSAVVIWTVVKHGDAARV